jgi:carbonic anhydrase
VKAVEIVYRYEASGLPTQARPTDAVSARRRLNEGNRGFASLLESMADETPAARRVVQVDPRDLGLFGDRLGAPEQHPFAAVVGCSDARVPIELIFDEGPNDLFVVRVAGNSLGADALGSLRYAVDHLGERLKLVVVLGHSGCGAVTAAVDLFMRPRGYLELFHSSSLRGILDRLLIVVQAAARELQGVYGAAVTESPQYRTALIETAVALNAALTAYTVERELGDGAPTGVRAAFGVYLIEARRVWAPCENGDWSGLADAPDDIASFTDLCTVVARSERIKALLESPTTT